MANNSKLHPDCSYDEVEGVMGLFNTEVLKAVIKGDLDLNVLASSELANRGMNKKGAWVGFPKAEELHKIRVATMSKRG